MSGLIFFRLFETIGTHEIFFERGRIKKVKFQQDQYDSFMQDGLKMKDERVVMQGENKKSMKYEGLDEKREAEMHVYFT